MARVILILITTVFLPLYSVAFTWTVDSLSNAGFGSLRAAIDSAQNGDTIRFNPNLIANGSDSIVLSSSISFSKALTLKGLHSPTDTLFISGGGNTRIFNITNTTVVTLDSLTLVNAVAPSTFPNGGAILFYSADSLLVNNCFFKGNDCSGNGGAIYVDVNSQFSLDPKVRLNNSRFLDNSAGNGGAISSWFTLIIDGCSFINNSALYNGGAINATGWSSWVNYLNVQNSIFTGNSASKGGAISSNMPNAPNDIPVVINGCFINANSASTDGGGVFYSAYDTTENTILIVNSIISNNTTVDNGGGIFTRGSKINVRVTGSEIKNNTSDYGGGLCAIGINSSPGSIPFFSNVEILSSTISGNIAIDGGGIYSSALELSILQIDSSLINNNVATDEGGGIYTFRDGFSSIFGGYYPTRMSIANSGFSGNSAYNGGGVYAYDQHRIRITSSNSEFRANSSSLMGGVFQSSSVTNVLTMEMNESVFENNTSLTGGVFHQGADTFNLSYSNSEFNNNSSSNGHGGVGYTQTFYKMNVNLDGSTFKGNSSSQSGGVLFLDVPNIEFDALACVFDSNTASTGGGAINFTSHVLHANLQNTQINNNQSTGGAGGGMFLGPSPVATFTNCQIANNSAIYGGGVFAGIVPGVFPLGNHTPLIMNLNDCQIHNNSAQDGGGVFCYGDTLSTLNLFNSSVFNNIATGYGGGIVNHAYSVGTSISNISHSTFNNNTAIGNGGAFYGCSRWGITEVNCSYSTFVENVASNGGGIWSESFSNSSTTTNPANSEVDILNSTFTGNSAVTSGAAVYSKTPSGPNTVSSIEITGSIIALNGTNNIGNSHSPTLASGGYNIFSNATIQGAVASDQLGVDSTNLNLSALSSNGGVTLTVMPLLSSVAIDAGDSFDSTNAQNTPIVGVREIGATEYCLASYTTDVIVSCTPVTWLDGITYYASDTLARYVLVNASGCDSIISLDLTINGHFTTDTLLACDSLTWIDGNTYYSSNSMAVDSFLNVAGCDSVIWLDLTINYSSSGVDVRTACDSLTWINGVTYYSNNTTAKDTLINTLGCDSVVTLNLSILNSSMSFDTIVACDSLTWMNGVTYYFNNQTAKDTLVNVVGCDSIVCLNLTINFSSISLDTIVACDSLTWVDGITYYSDTIVTDTLISSVGCDSIVTLDLTIHILDRTVSQNVDTIWANETGATYQWVDCISGSIIPGETNREFVPNVSGNYSVDISKNGCVRSSNCYSINVCDQQPSYSYLFLANGEYSFTNTSTGIFTDLHWAFGDGSTSNLTHPYHTYLANGAYVVSLAIHDSNVLGNGCTTYFTDTILVNSVANSLVCNAGWVVYGDSSTGGVTVINSSVGSNLSYHWEFGDGDTSSLQFPSHTYQTNGPFNLCLSVDDGNGCTDMYCDTIGSNGVWFKNGFELNVKSNKPTGLNDIELLDQINVYPNPTSDVLNISGEGLDIVEIKIFDATGKLILLESKNLERINVSKLAVGWYQIYLETNEGIAVKKFMKQ